MKVLKRGQYEIARMDYLEDELGIDELREESQDDRLDLDIENDLGDYDMDKMLEWRVLHKEVQQKTRLYEEHADIMDLQEKGEYADAFDLIEESESMLVDN